MPPAQLSELWGTSFYCVDYLLCLLSIFCESFWLFCVFVCFIVFSWILKTKIVKTERAVEAVTGKRRKVLQTYKIYFNDQERTHSEQHLPKNFIRTSKYT